MFRATHTMKGNCGFLKLTRMQSAAHALEDIFNDAKEKRLILSPRTIRNIEERVKDLNRQVMKAEECLSADGTEDTPSGEPTPAEKKHGKTSIRVPAAKLKELTKTVFQFVDMDHDEHMDQVLHELEELQSVAASTLFDRYVELVPELAQKTGKQATLEILGGDVLVDRTVAESLEEVFIHLVRNCVDHGIESPAVRKQAGKPASGTVVLAARREVGTLLLQITDDGAGIDAVKILQRAIQKGEITKAEAEAMSEEEALQLIFRPGFSSKRVATDISGRGVGLDAIADAVKALGGELNLQTEIGQGSTFRITIPEDTPAT
jgi:chemotaxis protein histidine kinase CheA